MTKIRGMIVDSRVTFRRGLAEIMARAMADIEIVAATISLETAMARLEISPADFLIIESGLAEKPVLESIMSQWMNLQVLIYSGHEQAGPDMAIRQEMKSRMTRILSIDEPAALVNPTKNFVAAKYHCHNSKTTDNLLPDFRGVDAKLYQFSNSDCHGVVVIAVSTGGPNALAEVIPGISEGWKLPVLIVQHIPDEFAAPLAERLDKISRLDVKIASDGEILKGGMCRIAPGKRHLEIARQGSHVMTRFSDTPPENSCKPAADVLFRSAAAAFGRDTIAVVLTGMGRDGCAGARAISQAGGQILVQDEKTSVVWGMPGSVVEAGLNPLIVPLEKISDEINRLCGARS